MSWVVVAVGVGTAVVGTGVTLYQQDKNADAINSVKPKKFVPVDIGKTQEQAFAADVSGYEISDADFKKRFPRLVEGRDYSVADANAQREGATAAQVTSTLDRAGLSADMGGTSYQQAKKLGMPILSKEGRDRNYFQRALAMNPQRTAGLSGQDVARIAITNTNSQNNFNQGLFGSRMNQYASQTAQAAQNTSAAITGLTGALAIAGKAYADNRDYSNDPLNVKYYDYNKKT